MGIDAPDWQRQIFVNTAVATNLPIDIDQQSLPVMTTGPVQLFDIYKRTIVQDTAINLTSGQTLSVNSLSSSGVGGAIRLITNTPEVQVKVEYDSVLKTTSITKNVWGEWGGSFHENEMFAEVILWDDVNSKYILTMSWGWRFIFSTKVEIFVFNNSAGAAVVDRASLAVMETR